MVKVHCTGVAVADFVFFVDEFPTQALKYKAKESEIVGGGCAANAAVTVARLGGEVSLAARLGDDPVGSLILQGLQSEGVDCSPALVKPGAKSSYSSIMIDGSGERQIMNDRGAELPDGPKAWAKKKRSCFLLRQLP